MDSNSKMKILRGSSEVRFSIAAAAVTIGNFDGVHLGHRDIIRQVVERARRDGLTSIIYTFRPHPNHALRPNDGIQLITTYDEKLEILSSLGVDVVIEEPFSREFSTNTPENFFQEVLLKKLATQVLYVGYDFGFGRGRSGSLKTLEELCHSSGLELNIAKPLKTEGVICSSSHIREFLKNGDVKAANQLLAHDFFYREVVTKGDGRGHKIGFPTANIHSVNKLQIRTGVYATRTLYGGKIFQSITNVGHRPTFQLGNNSGLAVNIETHIFDFQEMIYGEKIEVRFVDRIRDEMKFSGVSPLVEQIHRDVVRAREMLHNRVSP